MRSILAVLFVFCFSVAGFSQFETPNRSIKISPVKKPDAPPSQTAPPNTPAIIRYESSLDKKDEKLLKGFTLLPKKEEKSIMDTSDPTLRDISEVHTKQQNDKLKMEGLSQEIVNSDVFLGEYIVNTPNINTRCRDYGAVDGDNVRIWVNDEIIVPRLVLESGFKNYELHLREGLNIIRIQAINTGNYFPNTGQFVFYDANGKLISNQNWGLNEGYNAIVRVYYKKGLPTTTQE